MLAWLISKVREWFVMATGVVVLVGGLTALTVVNSPPNSTGTASANRHTQQLTISAPSAPRVAAPTRTAEKEGAAPTAVPRAIAPAPAPSDHAMTEMPVVVAQNIPQAPAVASPSATVLAGDAAAGRLVFRKCHACHTIEPGTNSLGPSLGGIIGKKAGAAANYNYSPAMKASNITWDVATLDAYLSDPQKAVPGNRMPFPGLKTENERNSLIAYLVATSQGGGAAAPGAVVAQRTPATAPGAGAPPAAAAPSDQPTQAGVNYVPGLRYTLRSGIAEGRMVYIGVGGTIDGVVNPVLSAAESQVVQITLINGEGAEHDIVFADQGATARSPHIVGRGASTSIAFVAGKPGDYIYFCSLPGHQLAGMQGQFLVTPKPPAQTLVEADISQNATEVPPPIGGRGPETVRVDLVTAELEGRLAEGTTFGYWTFNGKVPGPLLRVRVGDTVDVHLKNSSDSAMIHSVDFHAVTGPGGGAAVTQTNPGEETMFKFKALIPGLYVYHCATPMVAHHIANGMYGMILVEPEGGLPPVDREFYVMQGEIYTEAAFGQHGSQEFNVEKLLNERPEYFVFNGAVGALSKLHPLEAKVGETIRIFFGVGGPNFTSSFHMIGEIFDKVDNLGGVLSEPLKGVQTVLVPPGGAVIAEVKLDVPGNYLLVDHALSRLERGLVGVVHVEGAVNPEIFEGKVMPGSGH
jgi:nitrite reductase (NO-forming)